VARNQVNAPFPIDEKGRQKKTEVLDHIISRRKKMDESKQKKADE
jgi:hypothetical protein